MSRSTKISVEEPDLSLANSDGDSALADIFAADVAAAASESPLTDEAIDGLKSKWAEEHEESSANKLCVRLDALIILLDNQRV